jgi:hypothetical protein
MTKEYLNPNAQWLRMDWLWRLDCLAWVRLVLRTSCGHGRAPGRKRGGWKVPKAFGTEQECLPYVPAGKLFGSFHIFSPLAGFFEKFCGVVPPLQGLSEPDSDPGRRCALPWAEIFSAFQAWGRTGLGESRLRLFRKLRNPGLQMAQKICGILRDFAPFCGFSRLFWKYFFRRLRGTSALGFGVRRLPSDIRANAGSRFPVPGSKLDDLQIMFALIPSFSPKEKGKYLQPW